MAEVMCTKFEIKQTVPETGRYQLMINGVFQDGYAQTKGSLMSTSLSDGELKLTTGTGATADNYWSCSTDLKTIISTRLPGYDIYIVEVDYRTATKTHWIRLKANASTGGTQSSIKNVDNDPIEGTGRMLIPSGTAGSYVGTSGGDARTLYIRNITIFGYKNLNLDLGLPGYYE